MARQGVGLNPQGQIHYTDHLAPVCCLMDVPLLFVDEVDYACGQKYYPGLKALKSDYDLFGPEYLIEHYDLFFMSDLWDRRVFKEKFAPLEKQWNKTLRNVHVPHGFSDKGFYLSKSANEDVVLIYGQNMLDQLEYFGVKENLNDYVITGNIRYEYYKQHKKFFDNVVQEEVLAKFSRPQKTILYAPTWLDLEESTTFFDAYEEVLGNLPNDYNLIVKLHPRLELDDPGLYYHIIGRFEKKDNVLFLKDFPLIYPLLAASDLYLGDMSSVGYDFLAFNKPMFFLNKQKRDMTTDRGLFLFQCGSSLMPEEYPTLYRFIEEKLKTDQERFSGIRKEMYLYTFGEPKSFELIRNEILKIVD